MKENKNSSLKPFLFLAFVLVVGGAGVLALTSRTTSHDGEVSGEKTEAVVYHSPTCGCCGAYVSYLGSSKFAVERKVSDKLLAEIKGEFGIPQEMLSCHTAVLDGYFVEGHVPAEAIRKLLEERPNLKGIALPGMPAGAPGMGGRKVGSFVVYGISQSGETSVFAEL
ncbi:MAG: DUF411 domain-containing protein [bacterium]|nr:DUF411 domain-containing protein [bacterium]